MSIFIRGHVEVLGQCLSSAVQSREACHCDLKDIESAKSFEENGKESLISRQCGKITFSNLTYLEFEFIKYYIPIV